MLETERDVSMMHSSKELDKRWNLQYGSHHYPPSPLHQTGIFTPMKIPAGVVVCTENGLGKQVHRSSTNYNLYPRQYSTSEGELFTVFVSSREIVKGEELFVLHKKMNMHWIKY